jgi:hypothetical protein
MSFIMLLTIITIVMLGRQPNTPHTHTSHLILHASGTTIAKSAIYSLTYSVLLMINVQAIALYNRFPA